MVRRQITVLQDDLDGTEAIGTFAFAVEDVGYLIELSQENHDAFMELLEPYIAGAERLGRVTYPEDRQGLFNAPPSQRVRSNGPTKAFPSTYDPARKKERKAIRAWAQANGYEIAERGRIAQSIEDAYYYAQGEGRSSTPSRIPPAAKPDDDDDDDIVIAMGVEPTLRSGQHRLNGMAASPLFSGAVG